MANYYPNFLIETGLYTYGNEFVIIGTNDFYKGPYYKTFQNRYFTGVDNTDPSSIELKTPNNNTEQNYDNNSSGTKLVYTTTFESSLPFISKNGLEIRETYNSLKGVNLSNKTVAKYYPLPYTPLPTEDDYSNQQFKRYFIKRINNLIFYELSNNDYQKYKYFDESVMYNLFKPISLDWILTGDEETVYKANKFTVTLTEKQNNWYGLSSYLKNDYLKYYLAS